MELAACGLDCDACPHKPEHCDGCHASTDHLWCADCKIRVCCILERKLANCSQCDEFPCPTILDFESDEWEHHTAAMKTLRELRE